jgi:hypothetical protein
MMPGRRKRSERDIWMVISLISNGCGVTFSRKLPPYGGQARDGAGACKLRRRWICLLGQLEAPHAVSVAIERIAGAKTSFQRGQYLPRHDPFHFVLKAVIPEGCIVAFYLKAEFHD